MFFKFNSQSPTRLNLVNSNITLTLRSIALVVYYNRKLQASLSVLQRLYVPHFANVIFCGEYNESLVRIGADVFPTLRPFSYVHLTASEIGDGAYAYMCLSKV